MKIILTKGYKQKINGLETLFINKDISVQGDSHVQSVTLPNGNQLFYIGNIVGIRNSNDSMSKIDKNNLKYLKYDIVKWKLVLKMMIIKK